MKCPTCKNKGFRPVDFVKDPLKNMGGKECYSTFDKRKYVCLQCKTVFTTTEKVDEIKGKVGDLSDVARVRQDIPAKTIRQLEFNAS